MLVVEFVVFINMSKTIKLKIFFLLVAFVSMQCLANTPIKLQIDGTTSFTSFVAPSNTYTAILTGATPSGNYTWSISSGAQIIPRGDSVLVRFAGPINPGQEKRVKLTCTASYTIDNKQRTETDHIFISWFCPGASLNILGPTDVLEEIEETYLASVSSQLSDVADSYTWKINDSLTENGEDLSFTTDFKNLGGQTISISCEAKVADAMITKTISVNVHAYSMTVTRWDYSGTNKTCFIGWKLRRLTVHHNSTTDDNALVYVHYNLDDDDSSASGKNKGWDYKQPYFTKNAIDDDLCELVIDLDFSNNDFDVSDLNKTLTMTTPNNIRLWKSQNRKQENLLMNENSSSTLSGAQISNIIGKTIYVEGIEHNAKGSLEISFGKITKTLRYATCSVGDDLNQPTKEQRKSIKNRFENLIDCEWHVLREEKNRHYNCIAFSVDPYQRVFKNINYINGNLIKSHMNINYNYPFPFWVNDLGPERISCPFDNNDTNDKFWLALYLNTHCWEIPRLYFKSTNIARDLNIDCYFCLSTFEEVVIMGYDGNFKSNITSIVNYMGISDYNTLYLLTMNDFNPDGECGTFNSTTDVNAFFRSPVWGAGTNNLTNCSLNDPARVIAYYDKFHAARRASTLEGKEKVEEKNTPPGWYIFASKDGPYETIIHREEQIGGRLYGQKTKAYKY